MDSIVSKSQFAFIQGRCILDCSLIANEGIDYMSKMGRSGAVFKIDFNRAYDTVDWDFLLRVMKEMGFGELWCRWIFKCISTASISILVNGSPTPCFDLARGLRQGCSFSPLLFNLVGESLHLMIEKATEVGLFNGFSIGKGSNVYNLSHLQFADDLMVFCGASKREILNVKRVLRVFEFASGLQLNLVKSIIFGINVEESLLEDWVVQAGCAVGKFPSDYLGLPLGFKRNSVAIWDPIFEKFYRHLASWKGKNLSYSGKLVLVKSVLSALPSYYMSLFKVPCIVIRKLNSILANFLWGTSESGKKIHWMNWESVCRPLELGGLGIRNLHFQNRALLCKWFWNFANNKDSEWRKVLCCKLNWDKDILLPEPKLHRLESWIWKGISQSYYSSDDFSLHIWNHIRIQIGDGKSV
ncbi:hypothetical protein HRI_001493800 [Hibiscus trionum]|uniref:Reverse transcriptase domain-containing protein n=1 Tax=Hibiscus trionum TaxID=183268 RepID=A0A9W7LX52_HIBTR|nr:hypothetical protein HRI_001493800 [Hibiscus trionum]